MYRIQKRIYQARKCDNTRTVQKLQKLLMRVRGSQTFSSTTSDTR
ncbi:MAG TPA: reverse transcriptase N-terminal domain-containing protein [Ktedonobacteraceae bacterium]|nr:reverse transcriptase N-terminal domain-containing protein [Ktedonobacteraceae bacterium]